jgi:hypothetical protein
VIDQLVYLMGARSAAREILESRVLNIQLSSAALQEPVTAGADPHGPLPEPPSLLADDLDDLLDALASAQLLEVLDSGSPGIAVSERVTDSAPIGLSHELEATALQYDRALALI